MDSKSLNEHSLSLVEIMPEIIRGLWKRETNGCVSGAITSPQISILMYLNRIGAARMTDAARHLNITTAAATGLVARLVKGAYVQRVYDPADRRTITIKLTDEGRNLANKILAHKIARVQETFGSIPGRDREELLRILTNIKDILTQERQRLSE